MHSHTAGMACSLCRQCAFLVARTTSQHGSAADAVVLPKQTSIVPPGWPKDPGETQRRHDPVPTGAEEARNLHRCAVQPPCLSDGPRLSGGTCDQQKPKPKQLRITLLPHVLALPLPGPGDCLPHLPTPGLAQGLRYHVSHVSPRYSGWHNAPGSFTPLRCALAAQPSTAPLGSTAVQPPRQDAHSDAQHDVCATPHHAYS